MRLYNLLLTLFITTSTVNSLVFVDSTLASACIYYELQFDWGCASKKNNMKGYTCRCNNINWLGTVTNCIAQATDSKHLMEHAFKHVATRCKQKAGLHFTLEDMYNFYENGTKYLRDPTENDFSHPVYETLSNNQTSFEWYHRSFKNYTVAVRTSQWFGWGLVFYWVAIVSIASFYNIMRNIFGREMLNNTLRRRIVIPSIFRDYKDRTYFLWKFIPFNFSTRLNTLVVIVFLIQTIISVGVDYYLPLPHPYLTSGWQRNLTVVSFRTDLMSISLFPIIYLFGIRNNPLIEISGISYSTFNYFHKWCAYVCTVLAFIHSIIWTAYAIKDGGYSVWYVDAYWKWGIGAMIFLALLISHSQKVIRDNFYETFLVFHKVMNIAFILCMYYHCNTLGWLGWIWSMAGIWIYDRLIRILKIVWNGGIHNARLIDCGNGILKISVPYPKFVKYPVGSFAYLYFINPNEFWFYTFQSHPFTIMTNPRHDPKNPNHLLFYLKANKGITRSMLSKILKSGSRTVNCKMLIEGPYGASLPTLKVSRKRCVGVAGGVGVSAVYPHIVELYQKNYSTDLKHKFIWIINDLNFLGWFGEDLDWLISKSCEVTIIYTGMKNNDLEYYYPSDKSSLLSYDTESFEKKYNVINLGTRPNLHQLTLEEIEATQNISEDLEFYSCGSSAFNDNFRDAIAKNLAKNWSIDISLEEKSFTW
ncbi:hypothetical protein Kpol_1019p19 [Vanderwaltozyma polyspora DSM 70294]|uniref:FAD-binding FR-type domain-containing protein n=1 Tax=Vanderwaltozyma polyspora (strain ATCC 22028 / DSM 70294 / BCRC 21397 / CBS 2163 / NBRC 10782 / NRRL Y-8283 / UCD 57-17) TaxID=436907 RepID=A7TPB2_VANPO|nr:uncharacterized protein Kpol_1019p19 [Vanderwaltozyma polyspora DSM 70294]EDO15899.1 hypothetical protein Kpol_1019p19 [Vanderwaltozyma polyspora DSM 70294]